MKIRNDTLETRPGADGKVDVFAAPDMSDKYAWVATFVTQNLAEVFIEAAHGWIHSEIPDQLTGDENADR